MPLFLLQVFLPIALNVLRSYLYSPSNKMDGQLLDTVKQSVQYLASQDTNTVSFGHVASIGQTQHFGEGK